MIDEIKLDNIDESYNKKKMLGDWNRKFKEKNQKRIRKKLLEFFF